ncbi:hypothetical protein SC10_B2orf02857 [Bacillus paralicheniformis]|nr:hypothetical protein SC10_B2orf02857 [Bacillus paralicheniformis]
MAESASKNGISSVKKNFFVIIIFPCFHKEDPWTAPFRD